MILEGLGRHWYGDVIFCKMFKFLQTFSLTSSNYKLVAIAMDRHRAITRPLTMPGSPYKLLSSAWLFSLLPSLPCLFIFKVELRDSQPQCVSDFTYWPTFWRKLYFSGVATFIFAIPLLLFIGLYSHVVYELWATVNRLNHRDGHPRNLPRQSLLSRAQIKTTNLSMAVVLTFLLTNLPYIVDEFIRQKIVTNQDCEQEWCQVFKVRSLFFK